MLDVHAVKTRANFVTSSDSKVYGFDRIWRPHDIGFMSYSEVSALESGFKSVRIRVPDSLDTCGRGLNVEAVYTGFRC